MNYTYSLGGATTNVAAVGVTGKLGAKVAGKVAPNGINFGFSGCAYALAGGGTWESAIAISSSQVVSAGAVASAAVAGSNVIVAESSGGSSGGRMTAKEATKAAEELGFRKINDKSHGQPVYTDGKSYITPDVDSHNGGAWKMARSVKDLRSKSTRSGTYDANLNRIGD